MTIFILNGPNLSRLGKREPALYGTASLADIESLCRAEATTLGHMIDFRQTEREGELVEWLHEADTTASAVVLNPAAYGHTSIALLDAIQSIAVPVIECHLSNIAAREPFRQTTLTARACKGAIFGFGPLSYTLAIRAAVALLTPPPPASRVVSLPREAEEVTP